MSLSHFFVMHLLLGRGSWMFSSFEGMLLFPLQFPVVNTFYDHKCNLRQKLIFSTLHLPLTVGLQIELITLRAWVFLTNSWTLGLSWTPPLCRWQPKNFSRGSWQIRWLKNEVTSGSVNTYWTSSMNDMPTVENQKWWVWQSTKLDLQIKAYRSFLSLVLSPSWEACCFSLFSIS